MRRLRAPSALGLATGLLSLLLAVGCSEQPTEPASPGSPPAGGDAAQAGLPDDMKGAVGNAIEVERERFRRARGRQGILAEEPRYSLFAEEVLIRHFFRDRKNGFFLDVGCAWPIDSSNTYYLEKHLGWSGIGVDALSDYADGWAQERPRSKFFAFLVTDRSGASGSFFKSPGLGLSSASREQASGKMFGPEMETTEIQVPMITLDELLDSQGVTKVDLVSMDIEGHEPKALAGFDIERFQPDLLVIEGKSEEVLRYMQEHGYERIKRYHAFDRVNSYFRPKRALGPG